MAQEKMTLHRALSELKLIDAKIEKGTSEIVAIGVKQKDKLVNGFIEEKQFVTNASAKLQSVNDLIERKQKIKSAIVQANGETTLEIAGKTMTIADAINFKAVLVLKKKVITVLKSQYATVTGNLNKNNEMMEKNAQILLEAALGKDNVKVSKDDVDAIRKPYVEANEFHLVDPLKLAEKIESLEKEVSEFEAEADACLSEINATTFIEI